MVKNDYCAGGLAIVVAGEVVEAVLRRNVGYHRRKRMHRNAVANVQSSLGANLARYIP